MMRDRIDAAPAVEPLPAHRRDSIRAAILDEISIQPGHSPHRHTARITGASAALAGVGVAAAVAIGANVLQNQDDPISLAAAAGSLPVSTAECSPARTSDPSALKGATYLLQSPASAPLTDVWMTVEQCPHAIPVAAFIRADGTPEDAALTIWGGDAESSLGTLQNFEDAQRVSLGPGAQNAWLVDLGWGIWIEWHSTSGSYLVTSAGMDRDTVMTVARSYQGKESAQSAGRALPDLDPVAPLPSSGRAATWYAQYGALDPTQKDGDPWIRIEASLSEVPWAARASVNPIPVDGLTPPKPAKGAVRSGNNGGFRFATWTTASGAEVQLMSNLSEAEVLKLADRLELVDPYDERLDGFDLTSPRTGGSAF